jgi:hypothetical protein
MASGINRANHEGLVTRDEAQLLDPSRIRKFDCAHYDKCMHPIGGILQKNPKACSICRMYVPDKIIKDGQEVVFHETRRDCDLSIF